MDYMVWHHFHSSFLCNTYVLDSVGRLSPLIFDKCLSLTELKHGIFRVNNEVCALCMCVVCTGFRLGHRNNSVTCMWLKLQDRSHCSLFQGNDSFAYRKITQKKEKRTMYRNVSKVLVGACWVQSRNWLNEMWRCELQKAPSAFFVREITFYRTSISTWDLFQQNISSPWM